MDEKSPAAMLSQARHCRELARTISDQRTRTRLHDMADEYEDRARKQQEQADAAASEAEVRSRT